MEENIGEQHALTRQKVMALFVCQHFPGKNEYESLLEMWKTARTLIETFKHVE